MRAAAVIWLVGAVVYLVTEAVAAAGLPGYSYTNDYISDLGVAAVMNIGAFIVHGSLFLLGAIVISRACAAPGWAGWSFVLAAAANAVGNILVGLFRSGTAEAAANHGHWHVIGAGLALVGGNVAAVIAGIGSRRMGAPRAYRRASVAFGAMGIACLLALIVGRCDQFSRNPRRRRGARRGLPDHRVGDHDGCDDSLSRAMFSTMISHAAS